MLDDRQEAVPPEDKQELLLEMKMKKSQRSIIELVLNWSLKSVNVGTARTQREVSSVSPPPLFAAPQSFLLTSDRRWGRGGAQRGAGR